MRRNRPGKMELAEQLRQLEEWLLEPSIRRDAEKLSALLADDFLEIGSSGRAFNRTRIIEELRTEPLRAPVLLGDFVARLLAPGIALVTYRTSHQDGSGVLVGQAMRTSIWVNRDNRWQLQFHQGTKIESPDPPEIAAVHR